MKIIAHRGASKQHRENSIDAFHFAADHGADYIEMDIRQTSDSVYIIFHDATLERVDGSPESVDSLTFQQLFSRLRSAGWPAPLRLDQLDQHYQRATPLLFHLKLTVPDQALMTCLKNFRLPFVLGVESTELAELFSKQFGSAGILAFMPQPGDSDAFIEAGAGIIRLWEHWLDPAVIEQCHGKKRMIWIMTHDGSDVGETNIVSLDRIQSAGADGVLLNDICLAQTWRKMHQKC